MTAPKYVHLQAALGIARRRVSETRLQIAMHGHDRNAARKLRDRLAAYETALEKAVGRHSVKQPWALFASEDGTLYAVYADTWEQRALVAAKAALAGWSVRSYRYQPPAGAVVTHV